jgi:hypothetical protein
MVKKDVTEKKISLPTQTGELRDDIFALSNTLSVMVRQKQFNWEVQTLLERYAEPYQALLWKLWGQDYQWNLLDKGM